MLLDARQVSDLLASRAKDVCMHLLPNGKKCGSQWQVGSISGEPGKSLNVQLSGVKIGVWADFSTGESGDMLELWKRTRDLTFAQALEESCKFLGIKNANVSKPKQQRKEYTRPTKEGITKPKDNVYDYFKSRGIEKEIVDYMKIAQDKNGFITFPFLRDNELLAMKFLMPKQWIKEDKNKWHKTKDSEPSLWGWHGITEYCDDVVITEGEIDALTCYQIGMQALSIPSGANDIDSWLENEFDRLQKFKTIILCLDNDEPGQLATEKIALRLGLHRILFVSLPEKDANDTFIKKGYSVLVDAINNAKPRDPETIKKPSDYSEELIQLLDPDFKIIGSKLPWEKCEDLFAFRKSEISIWTGYNGHGKTQLLNYVAISSIANNEKWMIYTPEMRPRYLLKRLITQTCGQEFDTLTPQQIKAGLDFLDNGLFIYDATRTESIEKILESFAYAKKRYNVNNFVIDSLQKCGLPEGGDGELAAQKRFMDTLCDFKNEFDCHLHLVAHPRKSKSDESLPPSKQDIKGSGSISDLVDNVLIVHRNKLKEENPSEKQNECDVSLIIDKQRNGEWEGKIELFYCKKSYQYKAHQNESTKRFYLFA